MDIPTLTVSTRKPAGSRAAARLRRQGQLPAVVYGHGQDPVAVTLDCKSVEHHLDHGVHLINLKLENKEQPCLFKDAQYDHLGMHLLHLDLTRVDLAEKVTVRVQIEFRGTPKGVKDGGLLSLEMKEIEIECMVKDIPEEVRINVEHLGINDVLHMKDVSLDPALKAMADPDAVVAAVREPTVAEEPTEATAEGAEAAEPEVIAKGKEEKEPEES